MHKLFACLIAALIAVAAALAEAPPNETFLQVDGAEMAVALPDGFIRLPADPLDANRFRYTFENPASGVRWIAEGCLPDQEEQNIVLRKVKDPSNRFVLFDDVLLGECRYLAYCSAINTRMWNFLMLTEAGYSYRFYYMLPEQQGQDTIPDEAMVILSTLRLTLPGD